MRFGLLASADEDAKMASRIATNSNRKTWAGLGFRAMNALVHDSDRVLILAELEVRKLLKLVSMAEDKDTGISDLRLIGQRNMSKQVSKAARDKLALSAVNSKAEKEVLDFMGRAKHYANKFRGVDANYNAEAELPVRLRMEAKGVAYNNLSVAYHRLAVVLVEHAGKESVFGLQGDGTPLIGD